MNKLLIGAAVVALGFGLAAPAHAQVKLDLGGHFKGYGAWVDQDTRGSQRRLGNAVADADGFVGTDLIDQGALVDGEERSLDILRETEIHFTGETTLDNGLTVGFHAEADIDAPGADGFATEEAYAYFSGAWGRVNFGKEDGSAYLLQVAAPSADSNIDGIRQYVSPVNYNIIGHTGNQYLLGEPAAVAGVNDVSLQDIFGNGTTLGLGRVDALLRDSNGDFVAGAGDVRIGEGAVGYNGYMSRRFDYDHAATGTADKFTYLTPVFNGFQAGFSYTPEINSTRDMQNGTDSDIAQWGDVWEVAARYEGQFGELGLAVGAGYSHAELEQDRNWANTAVGAAPAGISSLADLPILYRDNNGNGGYDAADTVLATLDDNESWNVGVDLNWGPFGLGAAYLENDNGVSGDAAEAETWVVGVDYTTGPFKLGASYYNQDQSFGPSEVETDRWTGGVTYTYGPGMTFRGSVSYIEHDSDAGYTHQDTEATSILLGTQIDF